MRGRERSREDNEELMEAKKREKKERRRSVWKRRPVKMVLKGEREGERENNGSVMGY